LSAFRQLKKLNTQGNSEMKPSAADCPIVTQAVNTIIQVEMEERNLSRADMARRLEISPQTVTIALNDRARNWRIVTLDNWADAMNCDLHIEFRARKE
jgi:ribosome-binding protein aMBF1 (putative translation factor)